MANNLGTLASAVIVQRALALVHTKRPMLKNISTDLSDQKVKFGQSVISRLKTLLPVTDFGSAASDVSMSDVPVTINRFKQIYASFTQAQLSSTDRNLIDEQAEPIAVSFANHMVDAISALWTKENFAGQTTVGANWGYANTAVALRKALVKRGAPGELYASVNADVYAGLLTDSIIVASLNNRDQDTIKNGELTPVAGFKVAEYPDLPAGGENVIGFAGAADSAVIATRLPADPREQLPGSQYPGNYGIVTDPTTGLSVVVNEWINPQDNSANIRLCWMYGVAVGNANNGQLLLSA